MSHIRIPTNKGTLELRVSDTAQEIVRGVDAAALRYYERTGFLPVLIRVPWDWGGALYTSVQKRHRFADIEHPVPLHAIRAMEGNEMVDIVTFMFESRVGPVRIEVTPGLAMPQVYGEPQ